MTKKYNSIIVTFVLVCTFIISISLVSSDPPTPQNIYGKVFHNDSTGAENGIPVEINNTNLSQVFYTEVFAPPIPQLAGAFSLTINGSLGDYITIFSYNSTHYGEATGTITSGSTEINVTLNMTRPSETNVTIEVPDNNTLYNTSRYFNLTVNFSVIGGDGLNCNVTLNITNELIVSFPVGTNRTNHFGSIASGNLVETTFELYTLGVGVTNISATGSCSTDGINLEGLNVDYLENISTEDSDPPLVTLIAPGNVSVNKTDNNIVLFYNVSDASTVDNCSLYIDNVFNDSDTPIQKDTTLNFTINLDNGNYTWKVLCADEYNNLNSSVTYYHNVSVYYPIITEVSLEPLVVLNAGGTKQVDCNISVQDGNGASEISSVNATFYSSTVTSEAIDNNNTHYSNITCQNTGSGGNISNFTCSYSTYYYAINGSWYCNATSEDIDGLNHNNYTNTTVDTLYALNVSSDTIDFGDISPGSYSTDELLNITNFGNQPINISAKGYGGTDPILGDGHAMLCASGENISISNERFAMNSGINFVAKTPLLSTYQDMAFSLPKQTQPGNQQYNTSNWQLNVSVQQVTLCNGTITLTATVT